MEDTEDAVELLLNPKHVTVCDGFCQCHIRYNDFDLMCLCYIAATFTLMNVVISNSVEEEEFDVEDFEHLLNELRIVDNICEFKSMFCLLKL